MKNNRIFATLLLAVMVISIMSIPAHKAFAQTETETPTDTPTDTSTPTATDTPIPTDTLVPTATDVPATDVPTSTPLPTLTPFRPEYSLSNRITYGDYMLVVVQLAQCGIVILGFFAVFMMIITRRK